MSKAGLWPREKPRPTDSDAEIKVYQAFASDLPSNWTVWHSLRIRTDEGMEGEGDFVIAIPDRGFLVLEVKGGYLSVRDGLWYQNSKPLDHSPREQAHSFARKLVSRLPSSNGMTVPYGILTIFPDTPSSDAPVQDNLRDLVLTEVDLRYLKEAITAKLDKVADTFLRFKGLERCLERSAIIVTNLRLVKDRFDVRMHIALSRALDVVRVVGVVS